MEFKQLMIADIGELSEEQAAFVRLHNSIVTHSQMAASHLVLMAKDLKEMRDEKKYLAAGFESFGEYTQSACNIKERQAYNYIQILEKLPEDFLQSTAKIGITKLQLLAGLTEAERIEVVSDNVSNLENKTVKELEEQIANLRRVVNDRDQQLSVYNSDIGTLKADADKAKSLAEKEKASAARAVADLTSLKSDKVRIERELEIAREELKAANNKPVEKEYVADPNLEKDLKAKEDRIIELEKQLALSDSNLSKFTAHFETLQVVVSSLVELLAIMPQDTSERCKAAIKTVIDGAGL